MKSLLWGCPGMNFKVTLPFHKMRQAYAAFEKRPPWPLQTYFEAPKCYNIMEVKMKFYRRTLLAAVSLLSVLIFACVTINIYFPAEKVESVAGEIVNEIRESGDEQEKSKDNEKTSFFKQIMLAFSCPLAFADEVTSVANPTIRALKKKMKDRYPKMKPFYKKKMLKEDDNGYVSLANTKGLKLKVKRNLKSLIEAENKDRKQLYKEIAKALKIEPAQINKIADIFAKEWQKPVR
jgi:hypothetical protein